MGAELDSLPPCTQQTVQQVCKMLWLQKVEDSGGPSTCFLHDLCDLLESFSQSVCSGQGRGDITSTNERRKKGFSLILGSIADSQKTHGWPFPAYGELLTFLFTVVPNEKLRTMVSVMRSTLQFAFCYISALFWKKDAIQYKPTADNTASPSCENEPGHPFSRWRISTMMFSASKTQQLNLLL